MVNLNLVQALNDALDKVKRVDDEWEALYQEGRCLQEEYADLCMSPREQRTEQAWDAYREKSSAHAAAKRRNSEESNAASMALRAAQRDLKSHVDELTRGC